MLYGLYQSAAGMLTGQYRQDVVANNLANVSTPGFKRDVAIFQQRQLESHVSGDRQGPDEQWDQMTGGILVDPAQTDFSNGPLQRTNNPLDLALRGEGFFVIQDGGERRYTRDGRLTLERDGHLIQEATGAAVLGDDGQPIVLATGTKAPVTIDSDGTVHQGDRRVARLALAGFEGSGQLTKAGANQFRAHGLSEVPYAPQVVQGAVEASNTNATRSLAEMIEVSRAYEMNAAMVQLQDETLSRAVNDVARVA